MLEFKNMKNTKKYIIIAVALGLVILFFYFREERTADKTPIQINGKTVHVEIADSPMEQSRGLMFRKNLKQDEGMLFIFDNQSKHSFWMKNTLIALDIIWLDAKKEVVHIEHSAPPCKESPCPTYASQFPAQYVLELNSGWAIENNLNLGDTVIF